MLFEWLVGAGAVNIMLGGINWGFISIGFSTAMGMEFSARRHVKTSLRYSCSGKMVMSRF